MTQQASPIKNEAYTFMLGLSSFSSSGKFVSNPTIASGDIQISQDGGALTNIANLPTSTGKVVSVALTASEMNADNVTIVFSDQSGDEWQDVVANIQTVAQVSGEIDANIIKVNGVSIQGQGTELDPFGP